jgi:hypothetical protein
VILVTGLGCLVTADSRQSRSGTAVPEATFTQIEPGKTTSAWVQATLGEPTSKSQVDGSEIWSYRYTERTDSSGTVFLLFGGHSSSEKSHAAFVELKDGVVVKKWRADV